MPVIRNGLRNETIYLHSTKIIHINNVLET